MRSVTNYRLIKRNARIGQYTSLGALIILGIGLLITFRMPDKFVYSLAALLVGFFLSQVGLYYGNRWGRSPRADEVIDRNLKGLGREFTIYHYVTPASHFLVGPAGLWVLLPYHQSGTISYEKNRWRARGGGFAQSYLRIFGQENIGRPDLEAAAETDAMRRHLQRILPEGTPLPEIKAALLFTNPKVNLIASDSPHPALTPKDLKDFLREKSREKTVGVLTLETIRKTLPQPDQD